MYWIGIDIDGTKTKYGVFDGCGNNEIAATEDRTKVLAGVQNGERVFTSDPDINVYINVSGNGGTECAKIARDR